MATKLKQISRRPPGPQRSRTRLDSLKLVQLRKELNLNQPTFARLLPVSVRSLASLEAGAKPSDGVVRRFVELQRLVRALREVVRQEYLGTWLLTPNQAFEGLKPLEVIERGESDRLWSMVYFLRSGVPA